MSVLLFLIGAGFSCVSLVAVFCFVVSCSCDLGIVSTFLTFVYLGFLPCALWPWLWSSVVSYWDRVVRPRSIGKWSSGGHLFAECVSSRFDLIVLVVLLGTKVLAPGSF